MVTDTKIPSGYKQTEVGVIPEDWEVRTLGDITISVASGRSNTSSEIGNYPIYGSTGIIGYKKSKDYQGDKILVARVGANAGIVNKVNGEYCVSDNTLMITCSKGIDIDFSYYQLVNYKLNNLIFGSGQPLITGTQIKNLKIPLPPTKAEQTAIATVLSDTDALVSSLEELMAKKRNIKQGVLQEILTGKKRLPGFSGKWEVKKFTDVCWFQEGPGVRNTQFTCTGVKLLNGTNIFKGKLLLENTDRFISESEAFGPYFHFLADEGDIVIACSGITIDRFDEKISFVKKEHLPLCMNTSTMRFKTHEELLYPRYLYYYLMSRNFRKHIGAQATGSAQLNFGPSHIEKVEIILPKPLEQTAIALVLSDMDAEIEQLEQKLDKYRMIKQGMMQELLTGKTRLI